MKANTKTFLKPNKKIILSWMIVLFIFILSNQISYAAIPYYNYSYDFTGNPVPGPAGYIPERVVKGQDMGCGALKNPMDLFVAHDGRIFIADTGNNRIIILNKYFKFIREISVFSNNGKEDSLKSPQGVYCTESGDVYVADTDNARVVVFDEYYNFKRIIGKPEAEVIPKNIVYRPQKIAVDRMGKIYVVAENMLEGIVEFSAGGEFNRFFGATPATNNPIERFWRMFYTREQKKKAVLFLPTEYTNLTIDEYGFVYATIKNKRFDQIKRLNSAGKNIIRHDGFFADAFGERVSNRVSPQFVDISVSSNGNYYILDNFSGRIYEYNASGDMLFIFGGIGDQVGLFINPIAVEQWEDKIFVLDESRGEITIFSTTDFGKYVAKANNLYMDGKYIDALEPWQKVLRMNANYRLAYIGIGNAYYKLENYKEAMKYFELSGYRRGYSKAFKEYRTEVLRDNFSWFVSAIILLIIGFKLLFKAFKKFAVSLNN